MEKINPKNVTKPIQLLAAWFVALIAVNGSFLLTAKSITSPDWAAGWLVIASILNVPIFIASLFLLQTKFRAQLQEDSYYSAYLEKQYSSHGEKDSRVELDIRDELEKTAQKIIDTFESNGGENKQQIIKEVLESSHLEEMVIKFGDRRSLSELYLSPQTWRSLVDAWTGKSDFERDIDSLLENGLVTKKYKGYKNCTLTNLGRKVAQLAEAEGQLWAQVRKEHWEKERANLSAEDS